MIAGAGILLAPAVLPTSACAFGGACAAPETALEHALPIIRRYEGLRLTSYPDPIGLATIGYGHTGPEARPGRHIDEAEAERLLRADAQEAARAVCRLVVRPLRDGQLAALISFVFNVGEGKFAASSLRRLTNSGRDEAVVREFPRWARARKPGAGYQVLPGLLARRLAEAALYRGARDPSERGGE